MLNTVQNLLLSGLCLILLLATNEARPQSSAGENSQFQQDLESPEPQLEEVRSAYYELPAQSLYQSIPLEKLQMLYDLNRRAAYLRSPSLNGIDELYAPETKRQVRYRQCYFNPISCFKK